MPRKKARTKRSFGRVEQLPSSRYRARYLAPDGTNVKAPHTFASKIDAEGWLSDERRLIDLEVWTHPEAREKRKEADSKTFSELFDEWLPLDGRKETTQIAYTSVYNNRVKAYLGDRALSEITPVEIGNWVQQLRVDYPKTLKRNADAYKLVATVFKKAVALDLVEMTPCTVEGASRTPKSKPKQLLTTEEFTSVVKALPVHYQMAVVLADHCSLRISEWTELRKTDLVITRKRPNQDAGATVKIHVQRNVSFVDRRVIVGTGKTQDSDRWVHVSPALVPALLDHLKEHSAPGKDGLVFPNQRGEYTKHTRFRELLAQTSKETIGRRIGSHDFRHHGATEFARTGATIKEIMARLGHTTPEMAMRYQHASAERDKALSEAMPVVWLPETNENANENDNETGTEPNETGDKDQRRLQ